MTEAKKPTVFVRESTGLVRNVSFLDAISLNVSNMSAGAALAIIGFTMVALTAVTSVSGINLVYGSVIAFLLSIPQVVVYTMMTRRIPRTGGDYVWVSRIFGGLFGSAISFMGYTIETMAYLALIVLSAVFAIGSVGVALGNSSFLGLALPSFIPGSDPTSQFLVGATLFTLLIALNIVKPKFGYKLVSILIVVGVLSMLLAISVLLGAGRPGVESYINNLGLKGVTYSSVTGSYSGPTFDFLKTTVFILPFFAIFVYPWVNAGPAVASEVKGNNAIRWNVPLSAFIVFVLVTVSFGTMYYVGGLEFTNAALANPALVFQRDFNFWTLAMGVSNNTAVAWAIGLGWILWNVAILAYGIIVVSRYLFSQAFDRFLPSKIAYVSPRFGSPVVAHGIDLIITIFLVAAAAFLYQGIQSLFAAVIASMIYFFFVGIAAAIHATRNEKGQSRGILITAGALMAVVFLFLTGLFLSYPSVWGTDALVSGIPGYQFAYLYVVLSFVVGFVIYLWSKSRNKKQGIDISLAYKEIPPE